MKEVKDAEVRKAKEEETKNSPKEEHTDANEVVQEEIPENPVSSDDEEESKEFSPEEYEFNANNNEASDTDYNSGLIKNKKKRVIIYTLQN